MFQYDERQQKVADYLPKVHITHGLGSGPEDACSIAAVNLALGNGLTDECPRCVSTLLRDLIVRLQDSMPIAMLQRNDEHGRRWQALLPLVAGSKDDRDETRLRVLTDWTWSLLGEDQTPEWVHPDLADVWREMLLKRDIDSIQAVTKALRIDAHHRVGILLGSLGKGIRYVRPTHAARMLTHVIVHAMALDIDQASGGSGAISLPVHNAKWRHANPAGLLRQLLLLDE